MKPDPIFRAVEMLHLAAGVLREHAPDALREYDGTTCDGYCLADDCENAADGLVHAQSTEEPKP